MNEGPKILIVLNEKDAITSATTHLTKLGYQLSYASNVFEAMGAVTSSRPDLALVSWHLKSANVRSVVDLLTGRLKLRCIVFGEENDPTAAAEMTKAGFATTLPPPFYGPAAHSRIQQILSKKTFSSKSVEQGEKNTGEFIQNREVKSKDKKNMTVVSGEKVPGKTHWEENPTEENGITIWKGTSTSKKGKKSFYFFEGTKAPQYNAKQKSWEVEPGGLFYVKKSGEKNNLFISKGEKEDDKAKAIRKKLKGAVRKILKDKARQKAEEAALETPEKNYNHLLAQSLNDSLKGCMNPSGQKKPLSQAREVVAVLVNSSRFKGYIIAVGSESSLDQGLMDKAFVGMKENMATRGVPLAPLKTIKFDIDPIDFFSWAKANAEFTVTSQEANEEVAFAYLPIKRIPEYSDTSISGFIGISVGHGLIEGEPLLFDAYLHLPKNEKFILYMKTGSYFDAKAKAKYDQFGVTNLFIKSEDLGAFFIYCAKARVRGTFNRLDQQAA